MIQSHLAINRLILSVCICRSVHSYFKQDLLSKSFFYACVSGLKKKKKKEGLLYSKVLLLFFETRLAINSVVYRPMYVAKRNVISEKEHLSSKYNTLQCISQVWLASFFLKGFPTT